MAKTKKLKAFKIGAAFSLPGGRRYRKTDYYLAKSTAEEEILGLAQFAYELEAGAKAPPAPPKPAPIVSTPPTDPDYEEEGSDEPDWSYQTIASMRAWLDKAEVDLPGSRASKATHEELSRDAWTAGRRPNPLYGFPGGPEPSPGMSGPDSADPVLFAQAIELAHAGGFPVPDKSTAAMEELTAGRESSEPDAGTPDDQDTQEGTGERDGEPLDADTSEPSGSTNEADTEPLEVLVDGDGDELECEGCEQAQATHEDSEGVPLCQTCWAALADSEPDGDEVTIHEGEALVVKIEDDGGLSLSTEPE